MRRVIVADDREDWREIYVNSIRESNPDVEIDEATTGGELVERVLSGDYSLVITDNDMEGKNDGLRSITEIRNFGNQLPIYLVSGSRLEKEALSAGATGFYNKGTFDTSQIANEIRKHLGGEQNE